MDTPLRWGESWSSAAPSPSTLSSSWADSWSRTAHSRNSNQDASALPCFTSADGSGATWSLFGQLWSLLYRPRSFNLGWRELPSKVVTSRLFVYRFGWNLVDFWPLPSSNDHQSFGQIHPQMAEKRCVWRKPKLKGRGLLLYDNLWSFLVTVQADHSPGLRHVGLHVHRGEAK